MRVSFACDSADALWGLLHDASEAYLVDVPRPIKRHLSGYREIETLVQGVICEQFGLSHSFPDSVSLADDVLLHTEARDLMDRPPMDWKHTADPLPERIVPWSQQEAEEMFLRRFHDLFRAPVSKWSSRERNVITMPDPITLADVRAHIEQRIEYCDQVNAEIPSNARKHQRANAVRCELTEVLAMLDRVQEGSAR